MPGDGNYSSGYGVKVTTIAANQKVNRNKVAPVCGTELRVPLRSARLFELDRRRREQDKTIMIEILTHLTEREREAMLRFYLDREPESEIEESLGFDPEQFLQLRRSLRAAFERRTGRA